MTVDEIKSEFIGNTLVWKSLKSGAEYPFHYDEGGTRTFVFKGKKHTSPWRFTDKHLCITSVTGKEGWQGLPTGQHFLDSCHDGPSERLRYLERLGCLSKSVFDHERMNALGLSKGSGDRSRRR